MGVRNLFDIAKYDLAKLMKETALSEDNARRLKAKAELCQVKGIGCKISDLLFSLGVDSLSKLAAKEPASLRKEIKNINGTLARQSKQIKNIPSHAVIIEWIAKANLLCSPH
jgi:predicted flap endonuclease-1-like 5' DNA nuclease